MIRGIIFDFDGLIVDTEWPVYQSWVEMYQKFDAELPLDQWTAIIGTSAHEHFDPFDALEHQIGRTLEHQVLRQERRDRELELVSMQPILPGVARYLKEARTKNLKLGIASSSNREWVVGHLTRFDLLAYFDAIHTSDDVARTKPDPALYILALKSLNLDPAEAIVLEDSPNGIKAAKDAGIFSVAVPNQLTVSLDLSLADLVLESLDALPLADLIRIANEGSAA